LGTEFVDGKVSLTAAAFSADGNNAFKVPSDQGLDEAAHTDLGSVITIRDKDLLGIVESKVQRISAAEKRNDGVLEELVRQDGRDGFAVGTDG
jgi:hypothetical protein